MSACRGVATHSASDIAQAKARASGENSEGAFHIQGAVTFVDPSSDFLIAQDSAAGIRVALPELAAPIDVGKLVDITGYSESVGGEAFFQASHVAVVGPQVAPRAIPIRLDMAHPGINLDRRVSISGVVQSVGLDRPGLASMVLISGAKKLTVKVILVGAYDLDYYVDAELRVTGVLTRHPGIEDDALQLLVPDSRDLVMTQAPVPDYDIKVSAIKDVLATPAILSSGHRVRVTGRISSKPGTDNVISDATGLVKIRFAETAAHPLTENADLVGFPRKQGLDTILEDATGITVPSKPGVCARQAACGQVFRTAKSVHDLAPQAARLKRDVELNAVITYADAVSKNVFVQDETGGIYVQIEPGESWLKAGDRAVVQGVTAPGDFAPIVSHARLHLIGKSKMPTPESDLESIFAGRHDSQWVQMTGVVQDAIASRFDVVATVVWGAYSFKAHIDAPLADVRALIDRRIAIQGACGSLFNTRRQVMGVQLFVPGLQFARPLDVAAKDSRTAVPRRVASLLQFSPDLDLAHRVQIQGTVTLASRTGPTWVADANGDGIKIESHQPIAIHEGDFVAAFGFPAPSGYSALLRAGVVERLRAGAQLKPVSTTVEQASRGTADSQLIQVRGALTDTSIRDGNRILTLQSGRTMFQAQLPADRPLPALRPGSTLLVTGICSSAVSSFEGILVTKGFRLNMRSAADVSVMRDAPWLTFSRLSEMVAIFGLLAIGALCWAGLLRKHVRVQTAELTEKSRLLENAFERSAFQAEHDALTGLPNRHSFTATLESGIEQARSDGRALALMFIDLNRFKQVNDTLGHLVGDELLKNVAARLAGRLRREEILARIGGDEFAVVIRQFQTTEELTQTARRLVEFLGQCFVVAGNEIHIGASIGISIFPEAALDATELQKTADLAMYSVKNQRRNGFAYFTEEMRQAHCDLALKRSENSGDLAKFPIVFSHQLTRI